MDNIKKANFTPKDSIFHLRAREREREGEREENERERERVRRKRMRMKRLSKTEIRVSPDRVTLHSSHQGVSILIPQRRIEKQVTLLRSCHIVAFDNLVTTEFR